MIKEPTYLTRQGLKKLEKELEELKTVKRKDIAWRIQEAKELGDLSENAEYVEAKNEQAFIEGRICEVENILKNVEIIDDKKRTNDKVCLGSKIKVEDNEKTLTFVIVGSDETSPTEGKISHRSPIGKAFLGKRCGQIIEIEVPSGQKKFKIISIQ